MRDAAICCCISTFLGSSRMVVCVGLGYGEIECTVDQQDYGR